MMGNNQVATFVFCLFNSFHGAVKADEYPFNILTEYSASMVVEGNATVVNDLSYILSKLPENDRKALTEAITELIENAAEKNSVPMN